MSRSRRPNRSVSPSRVLYTVAAIVALVAGSFVAGFVLGQQVPMPVSSYFEAPESFELPSMAIEAPSLDPTDAPQDTPAPERAQAGAAADEGPLQPSATAGREASGEEAAVATAPSERRVLQRESAPAARRVVYASGQ